MDDKGRSDGYTGARNVVHAIAGSGLTTRLPPLQQGTASSPHQAAGRFCALKGSASSLAVGKKQAA